MSSLRLIYWKLKERRLGLSLWNDSRPLASAKTYEELCRVVAILAYYSAPEDEGAQLVAAAAFVRLCSKQQQRGGFAPVGMMMDVAQDLAVTILQAEGEWASPQEVGVA